MLKEKNSSKKPLILVGFARHTHLLFKKKYILQMFFWKTFPNISQKFKLSTEQRLRYIWHPRQSFYVSCIFESDSDVEPRSRRPEEEEKEKGAEEYYEGQAREVNQEPVGDEFNPEGFNPYPKEREEEKDDAIGKDYEKKFDFKILANKLI